VLPKVKRYLCFLCTEVTDGLCYQLTKPCPKEPEVIPFKDLEINRNEIQTLKKLGAGQFGEVWAGKLTLFIPFYCCLYYVSANISLQ